MSSFVTADLLDYTLKTIWPEAQNGRDYLVGHPIDEATNEQAADAAILGWRLDVPKPDQEGTLDLARSLAPEWEALVALRSSALQPHQFWGLFRSSGYEADLWAWARALPQPDQGYVTSKLEFSSRFERDDPLVEEIRNALNIHPVEFDALWAYALT